MGWNINIHMVCVHESSLRADSQSMDGIGDRVFISGYVIDWGPTRTQLSAHHCPGK